MFNELLVAMQENISTVRSIIKTTDKLREIAFEQGANTEAKSQDYTEFLNKIISDMPRDEEGQAFNHCAVVTRLYAIYESFVEDLITNWLALLPILFTSYSELDERIKNTHQRGVGRLLLDLQKNRYEHLSVDHVVRGLFYGVTNEERYELLPEAFLFHEQNLRREILERMLADVGIANAWNWVDKHRNINNFLEEIRDNQNTAEGKLNELISYRNKAAHGGTIDDVLPSNALLKLCDFVEALSQALIELVTYQVLEQKKLIGQVREIGRITEWFKRPKAGVAIVEETTLSVGESIFLVGEAYCQSAIIESIKIDDVATNEVQTNSGMELGLKFDVDGKKELRLFQNI